MKKFFAILAVLALTMISSMAFAEVTVSGSIDIRNLATNNTTDFGGKPATTNGSDENRTTQERIRLSIDAKHENVKGRVQIENDWDAFGRMEAPQGNGVNVPATPGGGRLAVREGWIDFTIPGAAPAHVKVGHQFLQLGNGWFFRSGKYGSDAWVVGLPGKNTVAFVDVKVAENIVAGSDDVDALVLLDNYKIDDKNTVGVYLVNARDPQGKLGKSLLANTTVSELSAYNLGFFFNGVVGPAKLQAEIDLQGGDYKAKDAAGTDINPGFEGKQIVLQASVPVGDLSVNAAFGRGRGQNANSKGDVTKIMTFLDADPHYTFVYEYFAPTSCIDSTGKGQKNTGFCNTQAFNLGASYKVAKNLTIALDFWMLSAIENVNLGGYAGAGAESASDKLGTEVDAKILWNVHDNLSWNWQLGRLMPGDAYKLSTGEDAENIDAIQGVLSYKF